MPCKMGFSWSLSPKSYEQGRLDSARNQSLSPNGIHRENVIQDRNIRHENVIAIDIIRHENVMRPCASGNIFAIIRARRGNYAERLLRADCAMESQAE
jgi:hypothetical protein